MTRHQARTLSARRRELRCWPPATSTPARADLPVIDTAALGEWATSLFNDAKAYALQLQQYATEVKTYIGDELSWATQAQQYATQLQQYANELQMFISFVHNPSLGTAMGLLSAAGLSNGLPINPYAVLGLVNGFEYGQGGIPEISGIMSSLSGLVGSILCDLACLHADRRFVELAAGHRPGKRHRRRAGCGAGGIHRPSHPPAGASASARASGDRDHAEGCSGHPGADRAGDNLDHQ